MYNQLTDYNIVKLKRNKKEREKSVKYFPQAENELRLSQSEFDRQVKKQQEAK